MLHDGGERTVLAKNGKTIRCSKISLGAAIRHAGGSASVARWLLNSRLACRIEAYIGRAIRRP